MILMFGLGPQQDGRMSDHAAVNRAFWDEIAPHHAASEYYAVDQFVRSLDSLGEIEKAELGPVAGAEICHLQCHIGLDTLSLANSGAEVTGVDFSAESLSVARELSSRTGIHAEFVQADVLQAAAILQRTYDLVFTTRGVLMWFGDLDRWASNCAGLLRPGGVFYLLDIHPLAMSLLPNGDQWTLTSSYFGGSEPNITSEDASYAVREVGLTHQETHEWIHPIGRVVTALIDAGLVIDFLHEHPADQQPDGEPTAAGVAMLPALFSIRAHRPSYSPTNSR
jgi:2-polyprenyl-3-methyl-5-hydroxy-6-metoxy-1,4-benzoquinol methylase